MIYRAVAIIAALSCWFSGAYGHPWPALDFKDRPNFLTIQDSAETPNVWRSPQDSLSEFPRLGPEDCKRYGSAFGYPECAGIPAAQAERKTQSPIPVPEPRADAAVPDAAVPEADSDAMPAGQAVKKAVIDPSLREMIGQLFLVTFDGKAPPQGGVASAVNALKSGAASGVLIRPHNVSDAAQLRVLTALFHTSLERAPLIAFEMPGGAPRAAFTNLGLNFVASPREISKSGDALTAFNRYRELAAGLKTLGINLNFGPTINLCPKLSAEKNTRCFGGEPDNAAAFATAFDFAHQDSGVLTAMPFDPSLDEGDSLQILRAMIEKKAPDLLIAATPDAVSPNMKHLTEVRNLLQDAGFRGALLQEIPLQKAERDTASLIAQAVAGGADLVLLAAPPESNADLTGIAVEAIETAVASAAVSMDRVREAYKKVQALKGLLPHQVRSQWQAEITSPVRQSVGN